MKKREVNKEENLKDSSLKKKEVFMFLLFYFILVTKKVFKKYGDGQDDDKL